MRERREKPYWSLTYKNGTASVYAWERLERGGRVFLKFASPARSGRDRREKQVLPGDYRVRDARGRIDKAKVREVEAAVRAFSAQLLLGQRPTSAQGDGSAAELSLTEGFAKALDIGSGKYPTKTLRWQEVARARTK